MGKVFGLLMVAAVAGGIAAPAWAAAGLDGTQWSVTVTPDEAAAKAGEQASKDTLKFDQGQMTSTACATYGFTASPYQADGTAATPTFQADQTSAKEGRTHWDGRVQGDHIQGTMSWARKDRPVRHYVFEGKKAG